MQINLFLKMKIRILELFRIYLRKHTSPKINNNNKNSNKNIITNNHTFYNFSYLFVFP